MIRILTHHTTNWIPLADVTAPILQEYANKHGYELVVKEVLPYQKYTGIEKLRMMEDNLEDGDIAFVVDTDVLITNHKIKLDQFIDDEHDIFICRDINNVNTGTMLWKWNAMGRLIHKHVKAQIENESIDCEQNYFEKRCNEPSQMLTAIKVLPHPSINSMAYNYYKPSYGKIGYQDGDEVNCPTHKQGHWEKGDFVLHCPGMKLADRIKIFTNTPIVK